MREQRRERESGQALAELAITVGLMLVMMLGLFDLGRAFYAQMAVVHAARDGARIAMDCAKTVTDVQTTATSAAQPLTVTVEVSLASCNGNVRASPTTVTVNHAFEWITPVGTVLGGGSSSTISRTSRSQ